ncbi:uncharacterized protein LOC124494902 isoform X2 [Dermatophagoides farinae]|uniref:VWFC domain-containing protein n=1 Tax=Dermatophagoides farinae TaxID=6954 RepID=A0A9D4NPH0_DERFA|nr:uncharacterized protein LOC124494902 [Dermatophagoides farinae]KAH7636971.1 hypothetical protein HUG17_7177 [Dermatophagoides farinae]
MQPSGNHWHRFVLFIITLSILINHIHCYPFLRSKRAFSYIANDTACTVDHVMYKDGDPIPTDDPCETCRCRPPGFICVLQHCEIKTGCRAIRHVGECCPSYQCGCEHNGQYYKDGERIHNAESPCYSCYCQGSSITCSLADCQFRFDCEPEYVLGECCPRYDHCPLEYGIVPSGLITERMPEFIHRTNISNVQISSPQPPVDSSTIEGSLILPNHVPAIVADNAEPAIVEPHSEVGTNITVSPSSQKTTIKSIISDSDPNNFRKLDSEIDTTTFVPKNEINSIETSTSISINDDKIVDSTVKIEDIEITTESNSHSLGRSFDDQELMINVTSNVDETPNDKEMVEDIMPTTIRADINLSKSEEIMITTTSTIADSLESNNSTITSTTESSNPIIMGRSEDDEVVTVSPTTNSEFVLNETDKVNNFMTTDLDSVISITTVKP